MSHVAAEAAVPKATSQFFSNVLVAVHWRTVLHSIQCSGLPCSLADTVSLLKSLFR